MALSRRSLIRTATAAVPLFLSEMGLTVPVLAEVPNADQDQWFWFSGHNFCMKATGKDTGGTSGWLMAEKSPRQGVPFHKHLHEDESFLVVEGTFEISVGHKTVTGGPGTYAFGPRNIPHR